MSSGRIRAGTLLGHPFRQNADKTCSKLHFGGQNGSPQGRPRLAGFFSWPVSFLAASSQYFLRNQSGGHSFFYGWPDLFFLTCFFLPAISPDFLAADRTANQQSNSRSLRASGNPRFLRSFVFKGQMAPSRVFNKSSYCTAP